jgi:DNA primase
VKLELASPHYDPEELKRAHPLADVVEASGVALKGGGRGVFWGLCPFHEERNPSLLVDSRDGHFHCFGCRAHGDVIAFVMRRKQLTFVEACAQLSASEPPPVAHRQRTTGRATDRERRWDRLTLHEQLVLNAAAALYRNAFWHNAPARTYLRARGIPEWVAKACGVGYSDGHSLEAYLRQHHGLRVAEELGLLRRSEPGEGGRPLREFFAGRLVVPELRGGQPIWMIGRSLRRNARVKYLALPGERPVLGLERAAGRSEIYLVEGVFDWLTALSWHLPAFSSCGTALPVERLGWVARARIVFGVLDADRGGREGAERFATALGRRWRPIALPDGSDLNDVARRVGGRAEFFRLIAAARSCDSRG